MAGKVKPFIERLFDGHDDPEDDEQWLDEGMVVIQRQNARVTYLSHRLRQIARDLNQIIAAIEGDEPLFLPDDETRNPS